jgi:hypothetical protein
MMELAMIEKFLPGAGKVGNIVAADEAWKRFLPADRQPLEFLEERAVNEWLGFHWPSLGNLT